jgi:hypothetical protein
MVWNSRWPQLRQELEESRAVVTLARASEEAGRHQLARMMDEQLAQTQTIEAAITLLEMLKPHWES